MTEWLTLRTNGDVVIAALNDTELTDEALAPLSALLSDRACDTTPVKIVLDLAKLELMGSHALTLLVVLLKHVREAGGQLALAGVTGHPYGVLEVMALTKVFNLYPNAEAAAGALR